MKSSHLIPYVIYMTFSS